MLLLTKLISQLILPPAIFILLSFLGLILWKKTWGRPLIILSMSCLWLLSTEPVRNILTEQLEFQYQVLQMDKMPKHQAAIVVLGGGIQESAPEYQGNDELSHFSLKRTIYAAKIAETNLLPIYTTGGTPLAKNTEAEGDVMKRWLIWFGIDEARITSENKANTTWENAILTTASLEQEEVNTVVLVTSAWHMPRAVFCFESQGLRVIPAPTDFLTEQKIYDARSFFPRWNVLNDSSHALHEYLGLVWYKLRY